MTKKVARHGGAPAPYTKQRKTRYTYEGVPLHNSQEGLPVTQATKARFAAKHGIILPTSSHTQFLI